MFMEGFIILWLHMKLKRSLICICPQWGELSMMHRQPEAEGGNPAHRWLDLVGCSYESQSGWMMFAAKNRGSFSVPRHTAARTAGPLLRTLIFSFLACRLTSASWHTVKASYVNLFFILRFNVTCPVLCVSSQGFLRPELLGNEFTHIEFPRRIQHSELGKKMLYRDHTMTGW